MTLARIQVDPTILERTTLLLPASLWSVGVHIGERVIVEGNLGDVIPGVVEADAADAPIVVMAYGLPNGTTCASVRRPRGGP